MKEQAENEAAYRQLLVQGVLGILLPTEDLENDCLTSLVGQILSEMILGGGIGGKAAEPWLLWEALTKVAETIQAQTPKSKAEVRAKRSNSLSIRKSQDPERLSPATTDDSEGAASQVTKTGLATTGPQKRMVEKNWSFQKTFWLILQYLFVGFTAIRFVVITIVNSSSLPSRIAKQDDSTLSPAAKPITNTTTTILSDGGRPLAPPFKVPIIKMKIWSFLSNLLDLDARMPWLSATISMIQWGALIGPGRLANTDGRIDR